MNRLLVILYQVLLLLIAFNVSYFIPRELNILQLLSPIGDVVLFDPVDLLIVNGIHAAVCLIVMGIVHPFMKGAVFSSRRRLLSEMLLQFAIVSLVIVVVFVSGWVSFSPFHFFYEHLLLGIFYLISYKLFKSQRDDSTETTTIENEPAKQTSWLCAALIIFHPMGLLAMLFIISPGILIVLFAKHPPTYSLVIKSRQMLSGVSVSDQWGLIDAYPGLGPFDQPIWMQPDPQDKDSFYMLSRPGDLIHYKKGTDGKFTNETVLSIKDAVRVYDRELGAICFAFHPDFGKTGSEKAGYVYLWYTSFQPPLQENRLSRFDLSKPNEEARRASETTMISQKRPAQGLHNGGVVTFGPDGFLYITVGDFAMGWAQSVDSTLSGGILRIDVDMQGGEISGPILRQPKDGLTKNYFIPKDNPWYGTKDTLGEFFALGMRNPFRAWVDPTNGDVWVGDVGLDQAEEHTVYRKGDNGQWPFMEAFNVQPNEERPAKVLGREVEPVIWYKHTTHDRATIAGFIYRGQKYPSLYGKYIFADNHSSTVMSYDPLKPDDGIERLAQGSKAFGYTGIVAVLPDGDGEIMVLILGSGQKVNGKIMKLVPKSEAGDDDDEEQLPIGELVAAKYESVCARCHGLDGKGNLTLTEGAEMPPRPDFTSAKWQSEVTDEYIKKVILEGGLSVQKSPQMPPWKGFLSDEEATEMVKFIRAMQAASQNGTQGE